MQIFCGRCERGGQTILQQGIAQEILRFHVIANSDSEAQDQQMKYPVRDELLIWMEEQRQKEALEEQNCAGKTECIKAQESIEKTERVKAQESTGNKTYFGKQENAESFLSEHLSDLESVAERVLMENGMAYHAKAELEQVYFSERVYGEYTFPAGWYETLRIRLGEGLFIAHFGVTLFMLVNLGADPFNVFIQGLANFTPVSHGVTHMCISFLIILVLLFTDRSYVKAGTLICMAIGGPIIDLFTWLLHGGSE